MSRMELVHQHKTFFGALLVARERGSDDVFMRNVMDIIRLMRLTPGAPSGGAKQPAPKMAIVTTSGTHGSGAWRAIYWGKPGDGRGRNEFHFATREERDNWIALWATDDLQGELSRSKGRNGQASGKHVANEREAA